MEIFIRNNVTFNIVILNHNSIPYTLAITNASRVKKNYAQMRDTNHFRQKFFKLEILSVEIVK